MTDFRREFIRFSASQGALLFGEFVTKAGRRSPYFFNAGMFATGESLLRLSEFYAKAILTAGIGFDGLFGPAYKGIPLVAGVAMCLAREGRNLPFSFNRKEAKDHGEGGVVIGAPLTGRILIVDDVISAGTSVRESITIIREAGAVPCGLAIALDRMERGTGALSAIQEVERDHGMPVVTVATLDDVVDYLRAEPSMSRFVASITEYRELYGVQADAR